MGRSLSALLLICVIPLLGGKAFSGPLLAGTASANITPRPGVSIEGSGSLITSTSVHDSLFAKVLVLSDGENEVAIVGVDLIGFFAHGIRERVRETIGLDQVLICASHTHAGPKVVVYSTPRNEDADYVRDIGRAIADAILKAHRSLQEVRIGVDRGLVDLSRNRLGPNGEFQSRSLERTFRGPVDREVGVVRMDRLDGSPLAVLVNYACHVTIIGTRPSFSADFPGVLRNQVEGALGDGVTVIYTNGGAGDVTPYWAWTHNFDYVDTMGRELAGEVIRVAEGTATFVSDHASVQTTTEVISLRPRSYHRGTLGRPWPLPTVDAELVTLVVNGNLAFVSIPGEPFVDLQLDLKARSPIRDTFLLGFTNGWLGYFPTRARVEAMLPFTTKDAGTNRGYGAIQGPVFAEDGSGEILIQRGLDNIGQMLSIETLVGEVRDQPRSTDLRLGQNIPNPFNSGTTISFHVPCASQRGVKLAIHNVLGGHVRTLVNGVLEGGEYRIAWDGEDDAGGDVASGAYVCRLTVGTLTVTRKMLLLK